MRIRYIAIMATLAASLLSAPTASACSLNPTAVISAPAASSSHIHGTGVSFVGTSSTANCGWISAYIWRNGVTVLSYSSSFPYNVTLEPEQVDSVITVSLQVINSYGRSHTVNRTITIKRDHQSQYFVKDHLGSPRVVVDGKGTVLSHTDYYPFGMVMPGRAGNISLSNDRVKFTGYLLEEEGGQDTYHAEARGYDPVIGRFTSRDPLADHGGQTSWTPYHYALNNPLNRVDPTGQMSTIVEANDDGTYTVVDGGDPNDGDSGIYVGNNKGEKIGESLTSHSFFDENDKAVSGAVIDPNDNSGLEYIYTEISEANIFDAIKFLPGNSLDFKAKDEPKEASKAEIKAHHHRGMKTIMPDVFGSARDFGNLGAGIVAGETGIKQSITRFTFDLVNKGKEPTVSRLAQDMGWEIGNRRIINSLNKR